MRHNKKFNHLSRKKGHREALLANLCIALIEHKRIFTTLAKAKALRMYAEPLVTRSKKDDTLNRRVVFSYLQNKEAVKELFGVISEKVADRPGGYLRILKTGHRLGDNAEMAMIEFVDFNENVHFAGYEIPLYKFNVTPKKPGTGKQVSATMKRGGGAVYDDAFIAEMKSGHIGVFHRETRKHLPISEYMGLSAAHMVGETAVAEKLQEEAQKTVDERVMHEVERLLNGYGG